MYRYVHLAGAAAGKNGGTGCTLLKERPVRGNLSCYSRFSSQAIDDMQDDDAGREEALYARPERLHSDNQLKRCSASRQAIVVRSHSHVHTWRQKSMVVVESFRSVGDKQSSNLIHIFPFVHYVS